eukprot:symbB.v1.2.021808.t1/scaffold1906.1/size96442/5
MVLRSRGRVDVSTLAMGRMTLGSPVAALDMAQMDFFLFLRSPLCLDPLVSSVGLSRIGVLSVLSVMDTTSLDLSMLLQSFGYLGASVFAVLILR